MRRRQIAALKQPQPVQQTQPPVSPVPSAKREILTLQKVKERRNAISRRGDQ